MNNNIKSIIYIFIGVVAVLSVLWSVIIPLILLFLGFYFISYGLKLRGEPPLFIVIQRWIDRFCFFN